jgi:DNA-binding Lrp family transcriptional regulator
MVEAYVLINCDSGKAGTALKTMKELKGVKNARLVTGLHDIVALIEAQDLTDLAKAVIDKIQKTEGVSRTVTMVAVEV